MLEWKKNGLNEVVGSRTAARGRRAEKTEVHYIVVSDMRLYSIRSGILSQWSVLRTGVM